MLKAILFDLDGTLLPMNLREFQVTGGQLFAEKMTEYGYDYNQMMEANWAAVMAMANNDGSRTNSEAFFRTLCDIFGDKITETFEHINSYYANEFENVKKVCGFNPEASKTLDYLKAKGYRLVLATTPWFPAVAIEKRIRWAGIDPGIFEYYSTLDNHSYCKPKAGYYEEVLQKIDLKPEDCLMVGNDATEDMAAEKLGMKVFLMTEYLENKHNVDISKYPQGDFSDLIKYIESL